MPAAAEPLLFAPDLSHPGIDARRGGRHHPRRDAHTGTDSPLGIAIGRALGTVVVTLRGELTSRDATRLRAVLDDLLNNQGNLDVVVDLPRLAVVDASGLATLAAARGWATERRAGFRLCRPCPEVQRALDAAGLGDVVEGVHAVA